MIPSILDWLKPWVDCPCGSQNHQAGGHPVIHRAPNPVLQEFDFFRLLALCWLWVEFKRLRAKPEAY